MLCLAIYRAVDPEDGDIEDREEAGGEEGDCNSEKVSGFFLLSVTGQSYPDHKYLVWQRCRYYGWDVSHILPHIWFISEL